MLKIGNPSARRSLSLIALPGALSILSAVGASGCGSSSTAAVATTPVTANVKITSEATAVGQVVVSAMDLASDFVTTGTDWIDSIRDSLHGNETAGGAGAGAGGLTSLKYFIETIAICQSMTTSGSAYSQQSGCVTLYSGPTDSTLNPPQGQTLPPDYATQTTYAKSVTTGYIDLMSDTARATIAASAGAAVAGSYNWGYVSWAYPVKVTATIPVAGLYTHSVTISNTTGPGGAPLATASTPLTTSPAAEAVVPLENGGTWMKFQNPFVISAADVSAATPYTVDLTFNPDNLIRGFAAPGAPSNLSFVDGPLGGGSTNAINVPMLDLTPVPRKASDATYVESYTTTSITGMTDSFSIRLELYYNSSDSTKSIYGATLRVIPTASTQWATDIAKIAFIVANATTATDLDFQDYAQNAIISGFKRGANVGDTTTVTLPCVGANSTSNFAPAGCSAGGSISATFQLTSLKSL